MIIAIGGLERSATNYTNYVFHLHPEIKAINYPTPREVYPGMNHCHIASLHKFPIPLPDAVLHSSALVEWHKAMEEKQEFAGVSFKYDRGEEWYREKLHRLSSRVLFIYCIRPLTLIVDSWMRWLQDSYRPHKLVAALKSSLGAVSAIRASNTYPTLCFDASMGMEYHRRFFEKVHKEVGISIGGMQRMFLEKRHRVAGDGTSTGLSEKSLLDPLYHADPPLTAELLRQYNLLLQEARDV